MKDFNVGYRRCRFFYKKRHFTSYKLHIHNLHWFQLVVGHSYFVFEVRSKERYRKRLPWTEPDGATQGAVLEMKVWDHDKGWV